jgi:hypothetical protein
MNSYPDSGRGVYLNCYPNASTAKRGAMVESWAEWQVKESRVDVTPESAGLSSHVPCLACCLTVFGESRTLTTCWREFWSGSGGGMGLRVYLGQW